MKIFHLLNLKRRSNKKQNIVHTRNARSQILHTGIGTLLKTNNETKANNFTERVVVFLTQ